MLVTANVFQPLIDVFETVLKFFHNSGGLSWGLSIVLLTIAVRAVLIPLTFRQIKSMVRMQGLQPQMKEIQAKYKQDKQRQQEEMMKFYRENNVNPLGSCLPLVLQLPVFVSLYYMLKKSLRYDICQGIQTKYQHAYALKHHISLAAAHGQTTACGTHAPGAHFLFISDLTAKATGIELGILIVLYVASQLGSTLVMSATSMDPTQRKIMMFMPLIFVLFVIRFPAGLLLYWITTNLWTVAQQYTVKRYIGPMQPAVVAGGNGAGAIEAGSSSPPGANGGGGIGGRVRNWMFEAQEKGAAARREQASAKASPGGNGGGGDGAAAGSRSRSGGANGSANGGEGAGTKGRAKAPAASSSRARRGGGSGNASGSSNGAGSAGNGGGSSRAGSSSGSHAGGPPPRPPRKKKKRSGRRR